MKKITIAIDGYSSSGKSTMARRLAQTIGYRYVDSGAMYRAVTLHGLRNGWVDTSTGTVTDTASLIASLKDITVDFAPTPEGQHTLLCGEDVEREIRSMEVSGCVSQVAVIPEVREALVEWQQALGTDGGIVMDGRDIGTTVFPNAELKVFVDAAPETRAQRRYEELLGKGEQATYEAVLENVRERDRIDTTRAVSPLRKANDARVLDNSRMTLDEQNEALLKMYHQTVGRCR